MQQNETKKGKKNLGMEDIDHVKITKDKISKEKNKDAKKHDRMLDRARTARVRLKNMGTKPKKYK